MYITGHSHVRLPEHNGHDPGHGHQDLDPDIEGELRHTRKREAPHVKKVQFIQLLVTKIIMKMIVNMSV